MCMSMSVPSLVTIRPFPQLWGLTSCFMRSLPVPKSHFRFCVFTSITRIFFPSCHFTPVPSLVAIAPFLQLWGLTSCLMGSLPVPRGHFWFCDVTSCTLIFFLICYSMPVSNLVANEPFPWPWGLTSCFRRLLPVPRGHFWFYDATSSSP